MTQPQVKFPLRDTLTLAIFAHNKPGVLMRICQVFSRCNCNIESLAVATTRDENYSRLTLTISGDIEQQEQLGLQLLKLIEVIECQWLQRDAILLKELMLIRISCEISQRTQLLEIIQHFRGRTVDLKKDSMIAMIQGDSSKLDAAIEMFSEFNILETMRTGPIAMTRILSEEGKTCLS